MDEGQQVVCRVPFLPSGRVAMHLAAIVASQRLQDCRTEMCDPAGDVGSAGGLAVKGWVRARADVLHNVAP